MTIQSRVFVLASTLTVLVAGSVLADETTVAGKLTSTVDDALYGVAVLRAAPERSAEKLAVLGPGSRVTVFPETSPANWWYIVMQEEDGEEIAGYAPRSFVHVLRGPYKDVEEDHWAAPALERLKESGFLTGYDDGRFEGERAFTRFEMAVMLDRYMTRLKEARSHIEGMIAKIPMEANLEGIDAKRLDEVVQKIEKFSREEADLRRVMEETRARLEDHEGRIQEHEERIGGFEGRIAGLDRQVADARARDDAQDRRIDELARTSARIAADLEGSKGKSATGVPMAKQPGQPGGEVATTLAAQVVRIKELMSRAENLESKVSALEARDRLAGMLMKDGARRSTIANLASRIDKLEGRAVGL